MLLGLLLLAGTGRAQPAQDLETLRARAAQGELEAQNALGNAHTNALLGLPQDFAEAFKWYQQAGEKGFAPAQFNLGLAYELGRGVAVDERQAFRYYLMAAEQGFAPAQFNVGNMYASGRGVGQDLFEANLWFKQAAENGLVEAQFNLGLVYETGRGVKKDDALAARWYRIAAERGYARAQYNYALLLEDGRGVARDPATAATLYRLAAEQGFAPAQVNYGLLLAEGRENVARDPVQAYVWLSRAVQNGATPEARDALARTLTPEQLAAAQQAGGARVVSVPPAATPAPAAGTDRLAELTATLAQARDANSRLAEANQRLEVENTRLTDELSRAGGASPLVDQLRAQSSRLAEQVQALTADKEANERQITLLTAQVRDAERDLAAARAAPTATGSGQEERTSELSTRLDQALAALQTLQASNAELVAANQRLQQERDTLAAAATAAPTTGEPDVARDAAMENLRRDNARLNDEVKRATLELLSLNRQLRAAGAGPSAGPTDGNQQLAEMSARVEQAAAETSRLETENRRLAARVAELENQPRPATDDTAALRSELEALTAEKSDLEKWSASLEAKVNELSAVAATAQGAGPEQRRFIDELKGELSAREQDLAKRTESVTRLTAENQALTERLSRTESELLAATTRAGSADDLAALQRELDQSRARSEQLLQENRELGIRLSAEQQGGADARFRVTALEQELASARSAGAETGPELENARVALAAANRRTEELAATNATLQEQLAAARDDATMLEGLRRELIQANAALEQSGVTTAELTAANQRLEEALATATREAAATATLREELVLARRGLDELAAVREENARLAAEVAQAAALRQQATQPTRENERLGTALADSRRDLAVARDRVTELENQLAEALTVRTRGADEAQPDQAGLAEANRAVEKLTVTVAELTAENQKLVQDLDNAQKSAAAALAAQSQAVSAARPDAFEMEISTLNARLKQLEAQVEEERSSAAREIATLASQLQLTRETNRSLTEANRALLSAKESEAAAIRDETDGLTARVRELTALNDELRRQAQQQADALRTATAERDALRSDLTDARQVATVLPGLSDENAALQERLEAVGGELVGLQRAHGELQQTHADLTRQLAASQQQAERAAADLAALQSRVAVAEQADEAQARTVAELTETNQRLGIEHEDMRRLVDSYRTDIARLTQAVQAAEQQKAAAERGGQQNIDALTAQMAQLRREVEAARTGQARQTEAHASQERERLATITQLRAENRALAARLNQAQGTLDQIAAAARLGTPASAIAAGGPAPGRPTPEPGTEGRTHTVVEGDSLSRISLRYYGTPNRWQEIFQANRDVLQGSSVLRIGMQLRIP